MNWVMELKEHLDNNIYKGWFDESLAHLITPELMAENRKKDINEFEQMQPKKHKTKIETYKTRIKEFPLRLKVWIHYKIFPIKKSIKKYFAKVAA